MQEDRWEKDLAILREKFYQKLRQECCAQSIKKGLPVFKSWVFFIQKRYLEYRRKKDLCIAKTGSHVIKTGLNQRFTYCQGRGLVYHPDMCIQNLALKSTYEIIRLSYNIPDFNFLHHEAMSEILKKSPSFSSFLLFYKNGSMYLCSRKRRTLRLFIRFL